MADILLSGGGGSLSELAEEVKMAWCLAPFHAVLTSMVALAASSLSLSFSLPCAFQVAPCCLTLSAKTMDD